jgi:PEP-CTERM motif
MKTPASHRKLLSLCIYSVLAYMAPLPAQAGLVQSTSFTASANYSFHGGSTIPVSMQGPLSSVNLLNSFVDSNADNNVFLHVYGNDTNIGGGLVFGSRSSGFGQFTADGTLHFSDIITNTSTSSINVLFTFVVSAGDLFVNCSPGATVSAGCGTGGSASYTANVALNGSNVTGGHSDATLTMDTNGVSTLTQSGFVLTGATSSPFEAGGATYSWGDTLTTLALGTLNPGVTWTLDYNLTTMAAGDFIFGMSPPHCFTNPDHSVICGSAEGVGGSEARIGDPSGLDPISPGVTAVPEPSTLALFTAVFLGFATRRKLKPA